MALILKIAAGTFLGLLAFFTAAAVIFYLSHNVGKRVDQTACRTLKPAQAAAAITRDVLRPNNLLFARYRLSREDIAIDITKVRISDENALVPFHITAREDKEFFGTVFCSDLRRVEYAHD